MVKNVGRKVSLIAVLLVTSIILLLVKDPPFNLGLDLQGGTRLVYSVDFEQAYEDGRLDRSESEDVVLEQIIQIIRNRVDPDGVLEPIIRRGGQNRIIIELPGNLGLPRVEAGSTLTAPLSEGTRDEISLADASEFPSSGVVAIGGEQIRYDGKRGNVLMIDARGVAATTLLAHGEGDAVELMKDDAFRSKIESLGELSFQMLADPSGLAALETDRQTERQKLDDWADTNPGSPVAAFNRLPEADGGPHPRIEWVPWRQYEGDERTDVERAEPLFRPADATEEFKGSALSRVYPTTDEVGFPAVGFEIQPSRRSEFGRFTEENLQQRMAIILNGEVTSAPEIQGRLSQGGRIAGRFTYEEVKDLMTVLRSGSLKIKPTLENDERVGATLGDDYVRRGQLSGGLAVIAVLTFIAFYYRRLGLFSVASMGISFVMLMGMLSFLEATLTLPGIAGIILTIGMSVDANILIFDRVREELDKGRNIKQAAKEGFDRAMPAILDANITTFLTAVILRNVGTGPVRGFAVTLMVGIITSVIAALIITRLFVHFSLERGNREFHMGQWMVKASYRFLDKSKIALTGSAAVIIAGLALFIITPDSTKLGIDFLGGAEAQIRMAQAQDVETVRDAIRAIDGPIGESAEVKPVLTSEADEGDGFTLFRVTFKTAGDGQKLESRGEVRAALQAGLADMLLHEPVSVSVTDAESASDVEVTLLFREGHPTTDIAARLAEAGLQDANVSSIAATEYRAEATTAFGRSGSEIATKIQTAFSGQSDSTGAAFAFADWNPSYSEVGPQVVGELRDKALLAMAVSLFVIVLYIRVRFAEYSYGFAAVAALLHDVFVTLGVLTLANLVGLINGEINLPMVAAFLTIIGYSLNDTIVIFDRVRENLPRMKLPVAEVVNNSINQTMSRTILTSFTTFLALAILFAFNFGTGNVLESFSFAMMIGVITGTYSTIFVANPVFLWLERRSGRIGADGRLVAAARREKRDKAGDDVAATAKA